MTTRRRQATAMERRRNMTPETLHKVKGESRTRKEARENEKGHTEQTPEDTPKIRSKLGLSRAAKVLTLRVR